FTRKAAAELRERFEEELEKRALPGRDQAFIGTIHAFCGRLLREHPLEAGLDPSFQELDEEAWPVLVQNFWRRRIDRLRSQGDKSLDAVIQLGIDPRDLAGGFATLVTYPDVVFPSKSVPAPDPTSCRKHLLALLARTQEMFPDEEPESGYDSLQRTCRRLRFWQRTQEWDHLPTFAAALASLSSRSCSVTQNRWGDKKTAKALGEAWADLLAQEVAPLLTRWREHCYHPVLTLLMESADAFSAERLRSGTLGFGDLLLGASRLLRTSDRARRMLGERFRHLLVDEFQDTDPIQAEICFLLASDPEEGVDWRLVKLRPGALFVVGDPKQSIYRFRRADIQTYEMVKRRIAEQGAVLRLVSNFRSVHPIAALVDTHFSAHFPKDGSAVQAPFAPLATVKPPEGVDGVFCYGVTPEGNNKEEIHFEDARRLASCIAQRIATGAYRPSDFLVLALNLKSLAYYARELAARNVPVSVTGAPLSQEEELGELLVILRALAQPSNAVLVAAVLEGLCFGLSPADLDEGHSAGLRFAISEPPADASSRCGAALATLYEWWRTSRRLAPDLLVEHLLDATGLLPLAAGLSLGDARAGALLHLVELLRRESAAAGLSLPRAVELIETALEVSSAETPLRPGRRESVRVMNLHKAKGLQSRVVVLAAPVAQSEHPPSVHVRRDGAGAATGGMVISSEDRILAQPTGWQEMAAREAEFAQAERQRLLYVAATRAERELIVSQLALELKTKAAEDKSFWAPLAGALAQHATRMALPLDQPAGRDQPTMTHAELLARCESAATQRTAAGRPGIRLTSVTRTLREEREDARLSGSSRSRDGAAWGRLVHQTLEAMGRGRDGVSLDRYVRALVQEELRAATALEREATVARVLAQAERMRRHDAWQQLTGATDRAFELPIFTVDDADGVDVVTQGIADAAALVDGAWVVLDWKTDHADDDTWARREEEYRRQVEAYARMIAARAGVPARGEIIRVKES
ncbi:MAG TPA: UvrD-helicase domain-containing protein, partial [Gemmatimonadales bacterium]|nr:UvrD-helicase domain-containing protein [Gemmatimonadales bacterium]